jgi:hypothetical protein
MAWAGHREPLGGYSVGPQHGQHCPSGADDWGVLGDRLGDGERGDRGLQRETWAVEVMQRRHALPQVPHGRVLRRQRLCPRPDADGLGGQLDLLAKQLDPWRICCKRRVVYRFAYGAPRCIMPCKRTGRFAAARGSVLYGGKRFFLSVRASWHPRRGCSLGQDRPAGGGLGQGQGTRRRGLAA